MIRPATESDPQAIADIYNYYIQNTVVTFEEQAISKDDIQGRIEKVKGLGLPHCCPVKEGTEVNDSQ